MNNWASRTAAAALALGLAVLLAACAAGPAQTAAEPRTASDQTDADRRAHVRLELAAAYFSRGQTETALDELKQALAAAPELPEAFNLRGLIYASMGENRLAEESFQRALQLNGRNGDARHNYGWFLCQQRRFADADAQFQGALALPQYRDSARTLLAQGVCAAQAKRLPDAERLLARAYELDPANPTTAFNLSQVLYDRGEYERARFYIRRVNQEPEVSNAATLWLAVRIENRLGNAPAVSEIGRQLRNRFPQAPQAQAFERGRFDE